MLHPQSAFEVRVGWGSHALSRFGPTSDAVVVVDVLSFSTAVDVACARGARVYPAAARDEGARRLAAERGAVLAVPRGDVGASLSPASLAALPAGARLVLPSPNGAALTTLADASTPLYAGGLRNARAVAAAASRHGPRVSVVAAGERWREDGTLRPALEDWLGAGAIVARLPGRRSPEAEAAARTFEALRARLRDALRESESGEELVLAGYEEDVRIAAELDAIDAAPRYVDGAYSARA